MPSPNPRTDDLQHLPGTLVAGKYLVERLIGRGGMGAVFAATNTAIGKRVALKFLSREAAKDPAATLRFQREAQAAGMIESEHIVHVFDAGTSVDGLPFLVMELLAGEDLRARLKREGTLPLAEALKIAREVLRALVRAHRAGIVHRDLKPDNVFLCGRDDGSYLVKIVDFGISKLSHAGASERLTYRGTVLGSAHYVSPEQAHGSEHVDHRADLWGVGVLLFEMLGGRPPHLAPSPEAVLVAICTEDAPDLRTFRPDAPDSIALAVARALSREPALRFASAGDFLDALSEATERSSRPAPRRRATLVLGVLAALLGFLLTAFVIARREPVPLTPGNAVSPHEKAASERAAPERALATPTAPPPSVVPVGAAPELDSAPSAGPVAAQGSSMPRAADKKRAAAVRRADAGVAGTLELSTREP